MSLLYGRAVLSLRGGSSMLRLTNRINTGALAMFFLFAAPVLWATASISPRELERKQTIEDRSFRTGGKEVLSLHKLNYAIVGGNDLKLQYSFKYRPVDEFDFFLAFTNYMLWDIYADSFPIIDNNFNPEAFYRFVDSDRWLVSADAGYVHLSNGTSGVQSRSVDRLFVRGHKTGKVVGRDFYATADAYLIIAEGENNPDYSDYLGFWDFTFWLKNVFKQKNEMGLDLQYQRTSGENGSLFTQGNNMIGLQYRFPNLPRFNPTFYVQWFNGYGEVILDYNKSHEELRGGISWYY
jgi:outer membrane phospholipase A